jgi:hypothetical protein
VEEAQSKWTNVNNLEQWFDRSAKADLMNSGLVIDQEEETDAQRGGGYFLNLIFVPMKYMAEL